MTISSLSFQLFERLLDRELATRQPIERGAGLNRRLIRVRSLFDLNE
jgi:hypothetical protein